MIQAYDLSIYSTEDNVDWKECLPYHLNTKIAFCMQPKRFISHSVLALCTAISVVMK